MINFEIFEESTDNSFDNFFNIFDSINTQNLLESENSQDIFHVRNHQNEDNIENHDSSFAKKLENKETSLSSESSKIKGKNSDENISKEASNSYIKMEGRGGDKNQINYKNYCRKFSHNSKLIKFSKKKSLSKKLLEIRRFKDKSNEDEFSQISGEKEVGLVSVEEKKKYVNKNEIQENPEEIMEENKDILYKQINSKVNKKEKIISLDSSIYQPDQRFEENKIKLLQKKRCREEPWQRVFFSNKNLKKTYSNIKNEQVILEKSSKKKYSKGFYTQKWTFEEHKVFIDAILYHGKNWKKIKQQLIKRSYYQIVQYTSRFFKRIKKALEIDEIISFDSLTLFNKYFLKKNLKKIQQEEQTIKYNENQINVEATNPNVNTNKNMNNINNCSELNYEELIFEFISDANYFNLKNFYKKYKSTFTPEIKNFIISNLLVIKKILTQNSEIKSKNELINYGLSIKDTKLNNVNNKVEKLSSLDINNKCIDNKISKKYEENQLKNISKIESCFEVKGKSSECSILNQIDVILKNEYKPNNSAQEKSMKSLSYCSNSLEENEKLLSCNKINFNQCFNVNKNEKINKRFKNKIKKNLNENKNKKIFVINKVKKPKIEIIKIENFNDDSLKKSKQQIINFLIKKEYIRIFNNQNKKSKNKKNKISMLSKLSKYTYRSDYSKDNNIYENKSNSEKGNFKINETNILNNNFTNYQMNYCFKNSHLKKLGFTNEGNEKVKGKGQSEVGFKSLNSSSDVNNSSLFNAEAFFTGSTQDSNKFENKRNTENEIQDENKNIARKPSLYDDLKWFFSKKLELEKNNFALKNEYIKYNQLNNLNLKNDENVNISKKEKLNNMNNKVLQNTINQNQKDFLNKKRKSQSLNNDIKIKQINNINNQNNKENLNNKYNFKQKVNVYNLSDITNEELKNIDELFSDSKCKYNVNFKKNIMISFNSPFIFNTKLDNRHFYDNFINNMKLLKNKSSDVDLESEIRAKIYLKNGISEDTLSNPFALDFNFSFSLNGNMKIVERQNNLKEKEISNDLELNTNSYSVDLYD